SVCTTTEEKRSAARRMHGASWAPPRCQPIRDANRSGGGSLHRVSVRRHLRGALVLLTSPKPLDSSTAVALYVAAALAVTIVALLFAPETIRRDLTMEPESERL